jgi:hypothetical protein
MCHIRRGQCGFRSQASPNNTNTSLIILDNIDSGIKRLTDINMIQLIFWKDTNYFYDKQKYKIRNLSCL